MECLECGNDSMARKGIGDVLVYECEFCGAFDGDAKAVSTAHMHREARERGLDPEIYPLVRAIERIPGFHVREASAGDTMSLIPPYLFVYLEDRTGTLKQLEHTLQSLEMSHRRTEYPWAFEAHYMKGELQFALRPRFMKPVQDVSADELNRAVADIATLARRLDRDLDLSWWTDRDD